MKTDLNIKPAATEGQQNYIAKEYEDFSYIVSHDLSAPLRHVKEFTRLLIGSRENNLSEEEKEYIHFLEKSLQKLDDMQRALLTFSRIHTRAGPKREVNLEHTTLSALQDLKGIYDCSDIKIEINSLPIIKAEPQLIYLLMYHLIENAIKFQIPDNTNKSISISAFEEKENWMISVKDNGIGIPERLHEEVFRLFKKLDPEKYPGIGAGLTLVRKISSYHNGSIFIKSKEKSGTEIIVSLPKS